jgi:tRNA (pseudouridine54-N1)-methyltransferase
MRTFVLFARKACTDSKFSIDDLPSSGGRMDVVARCLSSSLFTSHAMRKDVVFYAVLNGPPRPPVTLQFSSAELHGVSPDERSIGGQLRAALGGTVGKAWMHLRPGISVAGKSLQEIIKELADAGKPIYVLHEDGKPIEEVKLESDPVFVIGDQVGIPDKDEKFVLRYAKEKVSLGTTPYLASSVISVLNWAADRRGL